MTCGVSGSGKTTLARRLEQRGFTRLSADALIWQRYGDAFPALPAEERARTFQAVAAELPARLAELLDKEGRRVVVDATLCRRAKRDELRRACRSRGVEPRLAFLSAPREELLRRLALRAGAGPDDQRVAPALLDAYLAGFEPPAPDERPLTLPFQPMASSPDL